MLYIKAKVLKMTDTQKLRKFLFQFQNSQKNVYLFLKGTVKTKSEIQLLYDM